MSTVRDYVPPPPAPRGGSSCWKWGGIACGGGCLLIIIAGIIIFATLPKAFKNFVGQIGSMTRDLQSAATQER